MNKLEVDLFRYCCKQADYSKSKLYVYKLPWVNKDKTLEYGSGWSAVIYFQKPIDRVVYDFAKKNGIRYDSVLKYANLWLHKGFIQKEYNYNDEKDKYRLNIGKHTGSIDKYYNILPMRVFNHLTVNNPDNLPFDKPSYKFYSPKMDKTEKQWFRYLIRHCNLDRSSYDDSGLHIVLDNYYYHLGKFTTKYECSKNTCKRLVHKWERLGMFYETDGIRRLDIDIEINSRYMDIVPYRIYTILLDRYIKSFN